MINENEIATAQLENNQFEYTPLENFLLFYFPSYLLIILSSAATYNNPDGPLLNIKILTLWRIALAAIGQINALMGIHSSSQLRNIRSIQALIVSALTLVTLFDKPLDLEFKQAPKSTTLFDATPTQLLEQVRTSYATGLLLLFTGLIFTRRFIQRAMQNPRLAPSPSMLIPGFTPQ